MAVKTYGHLYYDLENDRYVIDKAEPHICIRLKQIFNKIPKTDTLPFNFSATPEYSHDLLWFTERYPLDITGHDYIRMRKGSKKYVDNINDIEALFAPTYVPGTILFNDGRSPRNYQTIGAEFYKKVKRFLCGDDLGLGKTITGIAGMLLVNEFPATIIAPSHLVKHWVDKIAEFTNLTTHVIKQGKPYNLPSADVYISKYSFLSKWVDIYETGFMKQAILDEVQDLRHPGTNKYCGAVVLSRTVNHIMALSATPIYNYGNEIFAVMNIVNPGCLGTYFEFVTEWCSPFKIGNNYKVEDPKALGTYLREKNLMLRRTRADVGRELPPVNKLVYTVEYEKDKIVDAEKQAKSIALRTKTGTFMERGQAAMELDIFLRRVTGISKARYVAEFVKILLDNGEPIVLAAWHRDVYDIWKEVLAEYKPVFYTGTENAMHKEASKQAFINGETLLFIMSLRSGTGMDGLQHICKTVVYGELDYSPKVHDQLTARVDRDGQREQVTAIYLVSEWGSDPVIIDILGLKSSQSLGIMDPAAEMLAQPSDESRIKMFAEKYLEKLTA